MSLQFIRSNDATIADLRARDPNKVKAAYRRGDLFEKRRWLMAAWTEFCSKPQAAGKVVPIRAETGSGVSMNETGICQGAV